MKGVLKVSVIVPVYNPGTNIDDCIESLLGQSLPPEEYEVIFVDDGSTDETPARLDALAAEHEHVRVEHIPNSGWPGKPRNIGIEMARGEYVYFVDNDDWIGRDALQRMHKRALRDEADIVIGKVVGEGKFVARSMFKRDRRDVTLEWPPLVRLLTPHKLFRKALLDEHGIRFPEGRRRLEDHVFVMHAYFHAQGISILTGYPCYHWVMREDAENASYAELEPAGYYANVREVLDLIDEHMEPGPLRDRLRSHWYRGKMLGRVGGRNFVERDPAYKRPLYEEVRRLALERYGEEVHEYLAFNARVRSRLLRAGDYEGLEALAEFEGGLRTEATVVELEPDEEGVGLLIEARIAGDAGPLLFERAGERVRWTLPAALAGRLEPERARRHRGPRPQLRRRAHLVGPRRHRVPPAHGHRDAPGARRPRHGRAHAGDHRAGAARAARRRRQGEAAARRVDGRDHRVRRGLHRRRACRPRTAAGRCACRSW